MWSEQWTLTHHTPYSPYTPYTPYTPHTIHHTYHTPYQALSNVDAGSVVITTDGTQVREKGDKEEGRRRGRERRREEGRRGRERR
jgi:hypothetical protein